MSITLILFILSLIGILILFLFKKFEYKHTLIGDLDLFLHKKIHALRRWIRYINKKTFSLLFYFIIEKIEEIVGKVFRKIKSFIKKP